MKSTLVLLGLVLAAVPFASSVQLLTEPGSVILESFDVGDAVEVTYTAPTTKGSICKVTLSSGCEENIPLNIAIKYHWPDNTVLNTKTPDGWASAKWISGIDYTVGQDTTIKVVGTDSGFDVFSNGNLAASYATSHNLGPASVKKVSFSCEVSAAYRDVDAKLKKIAAVF